MQADSRRLERQYSPGCQRLRKIPGGEAAMTAAFASGGTWVVVFQLRPLEGIAYLLGIPFRPHHPAVAVLYDRMDRCYYSMPASRIPGLTDGFVRFPGPLVWPLRAVQATVRFAHSGPDAAAPLRWLLDLGPAADRQLYRASDFLDQLITALLVRPWQGALRFLQR